MKHSSSAEKTPSEKMASQAVLSQGPYFPKDDDIFADEHWAEIERMEASAVLSQQTSVAPQNNSRLPPPPPFQEVPFSQGAQQNDEPEEEWDLTHIKNYSTQAPQEQPQLPADDLECDFEEDLAGPSFHSPKRDTFDNDLNYDEDLLSQRSPPKAATLQRPPEIDSYHEIEEQDYAMPGSPATSVNNEALNTSVSSPTFNQEIPSSPAEKHEEQAPIQQIEENYEEEEAGMQDYEKVVQQEEAQIEEDVNNADVSFNETAQEQTVEEQYPETHDDEIKPTENEITTANNEESKIDNMDTDVAGEDPSVIIEAPQNAKEPQEASIVDKSIPTSPLILGTAKETPEPSKEIISSSSTPASSLAPPAAPTEAANPIPSSSSQVMTSQPIENFPITESQQSYNEAIEKLLDQLDRGSQSLREASQQIEPPMPADYAQQKVEEIFNFFGLSTFQRGNMYREEGHICKQISETIAPNQVKVTSSCWGTDNRPYDQEIILEHENIVTAHCNCPVAENCKHCCASVLVYFDCKQQGIPFSNDKSLGERLNAVTEELDKTKTLCEQLIAENAEMNKKLVESEKKNAQQQQEIEALKAQITALEQASAQQQEPTSPTIFDPKPTQSKVETKVNEKLKDRLSEVRNILRSLETMIDSAKEASQSQFDASLELLEQASQHPQFSQQTPQTTQDPAFSMFSQTFDSSATSKSASSSSSFHAPRSPSNVRLSQLAFSATSTTSAPVYSLDFGGREPTVTQMTQSSQDNATTSTQPNENSVQRPNVQAALTEEYVSKLTRRINRRGTKRKRETSQESESEEESLLPYFEAGVQQARKKLRKLKSVQLDQEPFFVQFE